MNRTFLFLKFLFLIVNEVPLNGLSCIVTSCVHHLGHFLEVFNTANRSQDHVVSLLSAHTTHQTHQYA